MSVLPVAGSGLPSDSDEGAVVCTALLDEVVDDIKEVVDLCVGQLCFQTDSEDVLPMMMDELSVTCDLVRPDSVPANDVCGDDRFSPGVTEGATVTRQAGLNSHGGDTIGMPVSSGI